MGVRILTLKKMAAAVEVMVNGRTDAEFLVAELSKGGFEQSTARQSPGMANVHMYRVVIRGKPSEIADFLSSHSDIEYPLEG